MFSKGYIIHWSEEAGWAILLGVISYLGTELAANNIDSVTDWRAFAVGLAVGSGRVAAAVLLNQARKLFGG